MRSLRQEIGVGALLLAALAVLVWLTLQMGAFHGMADAVRVTAVFTDASGLVEDGAVRVAGVKAGAVTDLSVRDGKAVATLLVDRSAGVRQGAVATIRARSVLGEKYVELTVGDPSRPPLAEGDEIVDTRVPVEIDQFVTALGPVVARVRPEDVEVIVATLARVMREEGDRVPELMARLDRVLGHLETLTEVAPDVRRDLPGLLRDARQAARALPPAAERLEALLERVDAVAARVDEATVGLPETSRDLQAIVREVRPAADDVARAGERADEVAERIERALAALEGLNREEIVRILREEGVLVRLRAKTYPPREDARTADEGGGGPPGR